MAVGLPGILGCFLNALLAPQPLRSPPQAGWKGKAHSQDPADAEAKGTPLPNPPSLAWGGQAPSTHTPASYGPPYLMSECRSPQGWLAALQGSGQHHPIQRFKAQ